MIDQSELYDRYHALQDSDYAAKFQWRIIKDFDGIDSVLDFGCGRGHALRRFWGAGIKIIRGCDISLEAVDQARKQFGIEPFWVYQAPSLIPLPYKDRAFEMVFSADVLEHMTEIEAVAAIGEMKRVSSRLLVLSICFRPATTLLEEGVQWHQTIRPRSWWENHLAYGGEFVKVEGYDSELEPNLFVWERLDQKGTSSESLGA